MQRRSDVVEGCVNFPTHLPSSREGGMVVKLWAIDRGAFEDAYGVCCGANVFDVVTESFMGTDKESWPEFDYLAEFPDDQAYLAAMSEHTARQNEWKARFFAGDHHENSVPLLAAIVLGSTGWSNSDFRCTYADLSEDGKLIYDSLQRLYPKAELHLMTFLDT